jgi:cysteine desulfurase
MIPMPKPIYLDYNATTPHDPEVIDAMRPFFEEEFGNPSSSHFYGSKPKQAVIKAREQVALLLNCKPEEIIFTSGGTESNNFAIKGCAQVFRHKGNHIITSRIEHPAVIAVCNFLETTGYEVTYLPVDACGVVQLDDLKAAIKKETILISIMHTNNEVGSAQPIEEISKLASKHDIIMHTDAAQSVGKIPLDVNRLGVDLLSIAGHKIYAPKGVGALYIRQGLAPAKLMHGAGQEMAVRPGTENVLEIVGLGMACEIAGRDL